MMKSDLIFYSVVFPKRESEINASMLAESICAFGGKYLRHPFWVAITGNGADLAENGRTRLHDLDVRFVPFRVTQKTCDLFFLDELTGLEALETAADNENSCLVWMDTNTLLFMSQRICSCLKE